VRKNGIWNFTYNEALYGEYKDWHFVSYIKFSKYKESLWTVRPEKLCKLGQLKIYRYGDSGLNGRNVQRRCCQKSPMSQLEADRAQWNSLEAEFIVDQCSITSCSAVGEMDSY